MKTIKSKKKSNVVKFNNISKFNAAMVVFAAILLYVTLSVIISLRKKPVTLYRVGESKVNNNINCTGIAVRSELIVNSSASGYIAYFARDNEKIKKSKPVCSIDNSGDFSKLFSDEENGINIELSGKDYQQVRDTISNYKSNYSDVSFNSVYNFKGEVQGRVLDAANKLILARMKADKNLGNSLNYTYAPLSGILCFYTDGFENRTAESIKAEDMDKAAYKRTTFVTGDIVNSGSPIFKMIENEEWHIVCYLNEEEAKKLEDDDYVEININNSNFTVYTPYTATKEGDKYKVDIKLTKYMSLFANERYLNIEIIKDDFEGLKIPKTSLATKKAYVLPKKFVTAGGNSSRKNKVYKQAVNEDGSSTIKQLTLEIYKEDDDNVWVNPDSFESTDVIVQMDTNDVISVSLLKSDDIYGVYQANEGIADFHQVEILREGDEFVIVSRNGSLRKYDNIILNSNKVKENQIIY